MIKLNLDFVKPIFDKDGYAKKLQTVNNLINNKTGLGNDYLGWATWPIDYDKEEFEKIKATAALIKQKYDTLVVVGIGGSYLGARAAIEALNGLYPDKAVEIVFLGHTFSPNLTAQTLKYLENRNFAINVISKSGTTTETSIAFRLVKNLLEKKVGKANADERIFATTDKKSGALRKLALENNYTTFTLPGNIGGRYSVLTAVGLLPIAAAGIDIDELMAGALLAYNESVSNVDHPLYTYALTRDYLYRKGYAVELFVTYEPQYAMFNEWLKQLYGESEGKQKRGLFPGSVTFSTDLHSLGQFIQDGSPVLFETVFYVKNPQDDIVIPRENEDYDELNYLADKNLAFVNEKAFIGTRDAHVKEGNVPNIIFDITQLDAKSLGYLFYFFMRSCAVSAYLLEVNPFDQPGVEIYKRNMFALLGKK